MQARARRPALGRPQLHRSHGDRLLSRHLPQSGARHAGRTGRDPGHALTTTTPPHPRLAGCCVMPWCSRRPATRATILSSHSDFCAKYWLTLRLCCLRSALSRFCSCSRSNVSNRFRRMCGACSRSRKKRERTHRATDPATDHRERGKCPSQEGARRRPGQAGRHREHRSARRTTGGPTQPRDGNRRGF